MNIRVTGSNGYIGTLLIEKLRKEGHCVLGIQRKHITGPTSVLKGEIRGTDVIINLAGAPILQRWTERNRKVIYNSRILSTRNLVQAISQLPEEDRPKKLISASAIGIYKPGERHTEESTSFDEGFVGKVVKDWENELKALPKSVQTIIFRLGVVLGKEAKTIKNMLLPFKIGLGGKIGSGEQSFPFIHETDVINAFVWATQEFHKNDTFNLTAPESISNKKFTDALANELNRPAFFPIPPFALKLIFGKASSLLTQSPEVSAEKLQKAGFKFEFPTIDTCLQDIVSKS
ncbi:TIGR01777 family oxidoreductase [Draconibacterium sp. IB214405]|uniref:TIGR01777 family oxidoreductase n=1 Tax=Draconibacterium sp. IB214405 TaxID=3097352 RepID=UPI002A142197|nr:TIGR01777 family oxidoreductase [Draconibacterium sp. IB214405]MDX8339325.1 TIGR01777 family oxidoreductase [Draconibacterium sp. IB214405]